MSRKQLKSVTGAINRFCAGVCDTTRDLRLRRNGDNGEWLAWQLVAADANSQQATCLSQLVKANNKPHSWSLSPQATKGTACVRLKPVTMHPAYRRFPDWFGEVSLGHICVRFVQHSHVTTWADALKLCRGGFRQCESWRELHRNSLADCTAVILAAAPFVFQPFRA